MRAAQNRLLPILSNKASFTYPDPPNKKAP